MTVHRCALPAAIDTKIQDKYYLATRNAQVEEAADAPSQLVTPNLDPTVPAPMINVAEYGFEGRFEEWAAAGRILRVLQGGGSHRTVGTPSAGSHPPLSDRRSTGTARRASSRWTCRPISGSRTVRPAPSPALLANFVRICAARAAAHLTKRDVPAVLRAARERFFGCQRFAGGVG